MTSVLVPSRIELRRARQFASAVGKLQITFEPVEAGHDRLGQIEACTRLANRLNEDRSDFGPHGPAVSRGSASEQLQDSIIKIPDGYGRHGDHPFLLSMLAEIRRNGHHYGLGRRGRQMGLSRC
jgi:hypothetical protein